MTKEHPVTRYLLISFGTLGACLAISFGITYALRDMFARPGSYFFLRHLSMPELEVLVLQIASICISLAVAFILYVALTSRARTKLAIWDATHSLAISREQFRRLYEAAPIPYLTLNDQGEISEPNKAALRFFEVVPEEIVSTSIFSHGSPEDSARMEQLAQYYRSNIPVDRQEVRFVTKQGKTRWAALSIFEMKSSGMQSRIGLATLFDITEQKKLDQAKTEFVSLASHQLRTPLATMKWNTEMLRSGDLGELQPKQKEYVERMYASNEGMVELVDTLLNVSRLDMGTLPTEVVPTNAEALCESVFEELRLPIEKKGLIIEKNYTGALRTMSSDPKLLRIVIQNLVSNAVKYTPQGGRVSVSLKESPGTRTITVADTGYGIPQDQQDRIFTKLFRADNVVKLPETQGTGLGLYLVKSIVERLGGKISFVSKEGAGSTFTITM